MDLDKLLSMHPVPVYISKYEYPAFTAPHPRPLDVTEKDKLTVGKISFDVLYTPGHTPGCQCFLAQGHLFTGDTLFIDGCGRCDLPGSDPKIMYNSLYNILMKLPDETDYLFRPQLRPHPDRHHRPSKTNQPLFAMP